MKNITIFYLKISFSGGQIFSIFKQACFDNGTHFKVYFQMLWPIYEQARYPPACVPQSDQVYTAYRMFKSYMFVNSIDSDQVALMHRMI